MKETGDYYVMPPGRMLMMPPCQGFWGRVFGHRFVPRFDEKQDYPPNTMQGLQSTILASLELGTTSLAFDSIEKICEGYRHMDISETIYLKDVCTRCGLSIDRPRSVTSLPAEAPQAAPSLAATPTAPQPPRVVGVPVPPGVKVVSGALLKQVPNAPPGAPGSPVVAVPGRGPK